MARILLLAASLLAASAATTAASQARGSIIVHSALGGTIIGYDVDQNGTEGVLSEYVVLQGAGFEIAIETFDQKTGKVKIIRKIQSTGDFITLGVVGTSIALVERQFANPYVYKTTYDTLDPLDANKITGHWTPNLRKIDNHIQGVSESQGSSSTAVLGVNFKTFESFVFGANVATNVSGPITRLTDDVFGYSNYPVVALDTATSQAVVAAAGAGLTTPELAIVDLVNGGFTEFAGLGQGEVNGIAVDSDDGIACTTTQNDFNIEFYDIAKETGFNEILKGATSDLNSGANVQFDPVNKLFLIDQQVCAGSEIGSCIQVYDTQGNWIEATSPISGSFGHIAFNPNTRTGFLWLNDGSKFDELESFAY
jgi:hypothetical protein